MMNHYFHISLFIGCWHFDKRQRSRSAGLPGGVWIRAGCFYICHRAPGLRPRSDPDVSPAPSRKLPINPARLWWEWAQASVLDAFPPYLLPRSRSTVQASEPYQSKCNFSFHLFKMHPKRQCCMEGGRLLGGVWLRRWYHLQCLTHAMLFTCLCFSRSSGGFCGDKSEWYIRGIWELHPLRLREDGGDTPQDIVSPPRFVSDSEFCFYSCLHLDGSVALFPITNVLDSCRFLIGEDKKINWVSSLWLWIKAIFFRGFVGWSCDVQRFFIQLLRY